jgi:lipopolysaccharide biosynthesis glycosyltransferase
MDISLVSTIGTNYRAPLEVLISSLLLNKHASTAIEWHICTDEPDGSWNEWKIEIERRYCRQNASFIIHKLEEIAGRLLPVRGRARPIMYARLLVPEILPSTGRVLYLDADMLALRPIEGLWEVDLGSHPCACCQDITIPTVSSIMAIRDHQELKLNPDDPYLNAGVILIDIPRWKEKEVTARAFEYLAVHKESTNLFDQEALNAALGTDWLRISYRWNIITSVAGRSFLDTRLLNWDDYEASLLDPCILHYAGTLKPWQNPFLKGRWFELYRAALKQSLPSFKLHPNTKHMAQAAYDATIRRWVYPLERSLWEKRKWF